MCGICGIAKSDRSPVERSKLEAMNASILHRGPDGDGFFLEPGIGLAMRRLAIIDLYTGDQPISNEDETIWIVFNGEIFNFPELRKGLEKRGHQFKTQTDTECILHLYEESGVDCIQHLRGQFAFAIWDKNIERLFIGRDRMGQKPVYYAVRNGELYFGSELSCLLAGFNQRPEIDLQAIDNYLSLQYIPEPWTPYQGVFKLPAAHRMVWEKGQLQVESYWDLNYNTKIAGAEEDLIGELRHRVREAVQIRMISDVPLGAHLSGGIDSSIVVAMMAESSSSPVKTFTIGFEEESFSEIAYARAVAQRYETDHHEFILTYGDIPATIEKLLEHFGEPFADPSLLPLYYLSRLTRQHVTVALNGDGGDEAFAGYQRYWLDPLANRYLKLPHMITHKAVPWLVNFLPDRSNLPVGASLVNGMKRLRQVSVTDQRASILRWGSYFSPEAKSRLWRDEIQDPLNLRNAEQLLIDRFNQAPARSFMERTLYTDIKTYLPGDLLIKADRMTMANSLEGRSPFLDHEVASWAARLPENLKVRGNTGKYLLRKAFKDYLPENIQKRGKQGFGIPISAWLRKELAAWSHDILLDIDSPIRSWFNPSALQTLLNEHLQGRVDHGKRIWALTLLGLWVKNII